MPGNARTTSAIVAAVLLQTGCGKAPGNKQGSSNAFVPTKVQLDKVRTEGSLQSARAASKLEFWLHYKIMQANGMEEALGGQGREIAPMGGESAYGTNALHRSPMRKRVFFRT